jgi:hypothetical protein
VHSQAEIREALDLDPQVPLVDCDARSRQSGKQVLITLVEHLKSQYAGQAAPAALPRQELV